MLITRSGRTASQNEIELRGFIAYLQKRNVGRYLEIGARHGDTFYEVMRSLPAGSVGVAMDLPGGLWGTVKSRTSLEEAAHELRKQGYDATVIFGDSRTDATRSLAQRRGPYDAILIDGDHSLAGVTADWTSYGSMAAIVAFHDIVGWDQAEKVFGTPVEVPILWASLRSQFKTHEFIDDGSKMGIGVVDTCA